MTGRPMDAETATAFEQPIIRPVWIIRMDIENDPVQVWTGLGPLVLTGTDDPALEGLTFDGIANLAEISAVVDSQNGSQAVKIALAGAHVDEEALKQIVFYEYQWQFRQAWMWVMLLDEAGAPIGNPVRVKTGRLDSVSHEEEDGEGKVEITIESFQAYAQQELNTRYSEQREIDPNDTSSDYTATLANMTPNIQQKDDSSSKQSMLAVVRQRILEKSGR